VNDSSAGEDVGSEALRMLDHVRGMHDEFVDVISSLCRVESPTEYPETQSDVHAILVPAFEDLGFDVRLLRGRGSGDHLLAVPRRRRKGAPCQLLIGHTDTVWPLGTLGHMPVHMMDGRLYGPGSLDMKGGLVQVLFALRTLRALGLEPEVTPVVFLNSDEEVGSPNSKRYVQRLARRADRAFVLEPSLGPTGSIKTARKGVVRFDVTVHGRAAHAGLDPEAGASAIVELSHVIQQIHAMNDAERGTTVNVGLVQGGTRPNVIAASATAAVDVRVETLREGQRIDERMHALKPTTRDVSLDVKTGIMIAPLERTPRNRRLWDQARVVGGQLGFDLHEAMAGGGSDGNTTSLFTATLDGLGCVGEGAHADHEHIAVDATLDRCALLARLMLEPASDPRQR